MFLWLMSFGEVLKVFVFLGGCSSVFGCFVRMEIFQLSNEKSLGFKQQDPKGPNTSLEGTLGWFLGVKPLLRRYLDP